MDLEEKINILFYLFAIFLVLFILSISLNVKRNFLPNLINRYTNRLNNWDSIGDHESVLENIDRYIERFPGEANFKWAKARALFKLEKYQEAKTVFSEISSSEPLWKEDADKYIDSINSKTAT